MENINYEDYLPLTKVDQHLDICKRLNKLYRQKNTDYGDSYGEQFKEYGPTAGFLYIENKLRRMKQLANNRAQVKGESLLDSADDLINYAIMFRIEMEEWLK
jgi:hypothetical protein